MPLDELLPDHQTCQHGFCPDMCPACAALIELDASNRRVAELERERDERDASARSCSRAMSEAQEREDVMRHERDEVFERLQHYTTSAKTALKHTDMCPGCGHPGQCEKCWYVAYAATCGERDEARKTVDKLAEFEVIADFNYREMERVADLVGYDMNVSRPDVPAAVAARLAEAERKLTEALAEVERLRTWRQLYTDAPAGAKDTILQRMQESEAIAPIIDAWRTKLAETVRERDRALQNLELAEACAHVDPLPFCGHPGEYAYSHDGGAHIVCLLCSWLKANPRPRYRCPDCGGDGRHGGSGITLYCKLCGGSGAVDFDPAVEAQNKGSV